MSAVLDKVRPARLDRGVAVFAAILVLAALVAAVYHDSFAAIAVLWTVSTFQYALVTVPAAVYLLWRRRQRLALQPVRASWWGLAVLFAVAALWYVGRATALQAAEHAAAIMAIPALVLTVMGRGMLAAVAFPMLLLLVAIPVADTLTPLLMRSTADISSALLQLVGLPVYRSGVFISLPGGNFRIADVCAGLNYLLTSVTLALLFSYVNYRKPYKRVAFVALAALLFILGNGVRAFIVMGVASATELRHFAGYDHVIFGMAFFAVLLVLLLWWGNRFADREPDPAAAMPEIPVPPVNRVQSALALAAAATILALGPAAQAVMAQAAETKDIVLRLPTIAGCEPPSDWHAAWQPVIHNPDAQVRGSYRCGETDLHVMVATYVRQVQGRELVSGENRMVPEEWWMAGARTSEDVLLERGLRAPVNQVRTEAGSTAMLVWYWYSVNGSAVRSAYEVKLQEVLAALTLDPAVSTAYVVAVVGPRARSPELRERAMQALRALRNPAES